MTEATAAQPDVAAGAVELLQPWLGGAGDLEVRDVRRVFGGNARKAWSLTAAWTEDGQARSEDLILLVRSAGSQVQADPEKEFRILQALTGQGVRAPRAWAYDPEGAVFGSSAVLLARLSGSTDAVAWLKADEQTGRGRTLDLARAAAELHAVTVDDGTAEALGGESQLEHWRGQFVQCRLEPQPSLSWVFDWLADHQPPLGQACVVHGDFRPGNVLYDGERITGLLDWEMAHLGDPAEDLAWAYRALWSPARFVGLEEFAAAYEAAGGRAIGADSLLWHRIFSEAKFATISLLAARAVVDGTSTNLRLIDRATTVLPSVERCLRWIATYDRAGSPC